MKNRIILVFAGLLFCLAGCLDAVDYKVGGKYECDSNSDCVAGFSCYKGKCERAEDVIKWSADGNTEPPDSDSDGVPDDVDECPLDPAKQVAGLCGCNKIDIDSDSDDDKVLDCNDACPANPLIWREDQKGVCGCLDDIDSDSDGKYDCEDVCPYNDKITIEAQKNPVCGCEPDIDSDGDGVFDCHDGCPYFRWKTEPGICGCELPDNALTLSVDGSSCTAVYNSNDVDWDKDQVADKYDECLRTPGAIVKSTEYGCLEYQPGQYPETVKIYSAADLPLLMNIIKNKVVVGAACQKNQTSCINNNYQAVCYHGRMRVKSCTSCDDDFCQDEQLLPETDNNLTILIMDDLRLTDYLGEDACRPIAAEPISLQNVLIEGRKNDKEGRQVAISYILGEDKRCPLAAPLFDKITISTLKNIKLDLDYDGDMRGALANDVISSTISNIAYSGNYKTTVVTGENYPYPDEVQGLQVKTIPYYGGLFSRVNSRYTPENGQPVMSKLIGVYNDGSSFEFLDLRGDEFYAYRAHVGAIAGLFDNVEYTTSGHDSEIFSFSVKGLVDNDQSDGKLLKNMYAGGIVGHVINGTNIHDVSQRINNVKLENARFFGGFAGEVGYHDSLNCTYEVSQNRNTIDALSSVNVSEKYNTIGGLIGYSDLRTFQNLYVTTLENNVKIYIDNSVGTSSDVYKKWMDVDGEYYGYYLPTNGLTMAGGVIGFMSGDTSSEFKFSNINNNGEIKVDNPGANGEGTQAFSWITDSETGASQTFVSDFYSNNLGALIGGVGAPRFHYHRRITENRYDMHYGDELIDGSYIYGNNISLNKIRSEFELQGIGWQGLIGTLFNAKLTGNLIYSQIRSMHESAFTQPRSFIGYNENSNVNLSNTVFAGFYGFSTYNNYYKYFDSFAGGDCLENAFAAKDNVYQYQLNDSFQTDACYYKMEDVCKSNIFYEDWYCKGGLFYEFIQQPVCNGGCPQFLTKESLDSALESLKNVTGDQVDWKLTILNNNEVQGQLTYKVPTFDLELNLGF